MAPRRHLALTTLAAATLSAATITATALADSWPITTAACVICALLIGRAGRNVIMDWRRK
jgi:type IV secretory pathway VirB2 component (pilin)